MGGLDGCESGAERYLLGGQGFMGGEEGGLLGFEGLG